MTPLEEARRLTTKQAEGLERIDRFGDFRRTHGAVVQSLLKRGLYRVEHGDAHGEDVRVVLTDHAKEALRIYRDLGSPKRAPAKARAKKMVAARVAAWLRSAVEQRSSILEGDAERETARLHEAAIDLAKELERKAAR